MILRASSNGQALLSAAAARISGLRSIVADPVMSLFLHRCAGACSPAQHVCGGLVNSLAGADGYNRASESGVGTRCLSGTVEGVNDKRHFSLRRKPRIPTFR